MNNYLNEYEVNNFKELVENWLSLDDDIKKLSKVIKELRQKKNKLTPDIIKFMESNEIEDCNTGDGLLKHSVSYVKKPLSKKLLQDKLTIFLKNSQKGEEATKFIYENRDMEKRSALKRTVKKVKKNTVNL